MTTDSAGQGPVERMVRPRALIDASGHPRHLSYEQSTQERRLYGPLEPLFDGQDLWNACAAAGEIERDKVRARLLEMHERDKGRHNLWHCAVVEVFGPPALESDKAPAQMLVPVEPTTDMLYAMAECDGFQRGDRDHPGLERWRDYWRAAMAALGPNVRANLTKGAADD